MKTNKLIIAAAGAGKTTFLVKEALKQREGNVLITTYTQANEEEIRKKIFEINKCIPENITIQTWFSFLLQHGVRPYQGCLCERKINGMVLVNSQSAVKYSKNGIPVCYKEEDDLEKHYFTETFKIYSDKLSKFVFKCNQKSNGSVIDRLSRIYSHIFIDEVQDLAGYDLELIKLLLNSTSNVLLVGDPRQVTYLTHNEKKHAKYKDGKIKDFIKNECYKSNCEIDEETLNLSHRNNELICKFSSKLYPNFRICRSNQKETTTHDGIFLVKKQDIEKYLEIYNPVQLRDNIKVELNKDYKAINFGDSKGLTFERVLIYPTKPFLDWVKNNNNELKSISRSKFYVAITRAKYSVGIVYDYNDETDIDGIEKFVV
ncbi:UvrD-helicase domain-containing protein [Geosporobacter ferrireducens]|uniref:DNA helicase II n=1 Tax=Geosporobacter ferrireducens TaxID=1424294 RepID=A0A1D8GKH8_9FIRM|nr:UvrD-helicase domain-containing protein [Geosporobacter ferrireducens]AOT71414.1 DNA helicase II [Geosporobacter ferrireducens]MTI57718.1 ATP-dependent helicase [Geosporobacter ferrireducens]